jgi:hypothetical protein
MELLAKYCKELGRVCPDELPDVLINVSSDYKIKRWIVRNCDLLPVEAPKKRSAKKVKKDEPAEEKADEGKVSE